MRTGKAGSRARPKVRGFKSSPWTKIVREEFHIRLNNQGANQQTSLTKEDDCWDPEQRRRWIKDVQNRERKRKQSSSLITANSPQAEPLRSLPIDAKGDVVKAYEFFTVVYTPMWASFPGWITCCQTMLQDPMLFEQLMAYTLVVQRLDKSPDQRMTASTLKYSNKSVARLRKRLQSPNVEERTSDTVFMTILLLISLYVVCADLTPWGAHMQALRHINHVRGGSNKLGWHGFLELKYKQVEAGWKNYQDRKASGMSKESGKTLEYPAHPFDPPLCARLTKLPIGFRELALCQKLSFQFIRIVEEALLRMDDNQALPSTSVDIQIVAESVICQPERTELEHVLGVALMACASFKPQAVGGIPPTVMLSILLHARAFPKAKCDHDADSLDEEVLDWAALVLSMTTEPDSTAGTWAKQRMERDAGVVFSESERHKLQQKFSFVPT